LLIILEYKVQIAKDPLGPSSSKKYDRALYSSAAAQFRGFNKRKGDFNSSFTDILHYSPLRDFAKSVGEDTFEKALRDRDKREAEKYSRAVDNHSDSDDDNHKRDVRQQRSQSSLGEYEDSLKRRQNSLNKRLQTVAYPADRRSMSALSNHTNDTENKRSLPDISKRMDKNELDRRKSISQKEGDRRRSSAARISAKR
jgi:hypothetical protein